MEFFQRIKIYGEILTKSLNFTKTGQIDLAVLANCAGYCKIKRVSGAAEAPWIEEVQLWLQNQRTIPGGLTSQECEAMALKSSWPMRPFMPEQA